MLGRVAQEEERQRHLQQMHDDGYYENNYVTDAGVQRICEELLESVMVCGLYWGNLESEHRIVANQQFFCYIYYRYRHHGAASLECTLVVIGLPELL